MISSEALHLGPLMLPWGLFFLLFALVITSMIGRKIGQKYHWSQEIQQRFQDSIWTSVWIGFIGARLVFIGLNIESYLVSPIESIFKFPSLKSFSSRSVGIDLHATI